MREILFRGKRNNDGGEWHYGGYIHDDSVEPDVHIIMEHRGGMFRCVPVLPETVGQYTGLTDKNGKKIFEGDIIRYADEYDYRMYLESLECPEEYEGTDFSDIWTVDKIIYGIKVGYPAFNLRKHDFESNGLSELHESCNYFYEVIGNIHDNPELLEVINND